jgi:hypothetical protein
VRGRRPGNSYPPPTPPCQGRGLDETRAALQAVGQELVEEDPERSSIGVLKQAGWPSATQVVVDGIRHSEVLETLRRLAQPAVLLFVCTDVSADVRGQRLRERGEQEDPQTLEMAPTERQVPDALCSKADVVVDGSIDGSDAVELVVRALT